jgi:hypothetical protein
MFPLSWNESSIRGAALPARASASTDNSSTDRVSFAAASKENRQIYVILSICASATSITPFPNRAIAWKIGAR